MNRKTRLEILGGVIALGALGWFVAPRASSEPDGLQRVALKHGLGDDERGALAKGPLSDYSVSGVEDRRLSTGLAALIGIALTFGLVGGGFALMRRRRAKPAEARDP
ncbi:MAG: PDGLE domain-containing protein [Actinomycetota bacterium]|nr:PDGLE domain-containing protein [Actinomycetota bacterium]